MDGVTKEKRQIAELKIAVNYFYRLKRLLRTARAETLTHPSSCETEILASTTSQDHIINTSHFQALNQGEESTTIQNSHDVSFTRSQTFNSLIIESNS